MARVLFPTLSNSKWRCYYVMQAFHLCRYKCVSSSLPLENKVLFCTEVAKVKNLEVTTPSNLALAMNIALNANLRMCLFARFFVF